MVRKNNSNILNLSLLNFFNFSEKQSYAFYTTLKTPFPRIHRSKSNVSILTLEDYARIRRNMQESKPKEKKNKQIIYSQQKESQLSKARDHLKRMKEYDLIRPNYVWCNTGRAQEAKNKKILYYAKQCKENEMDLTKRMNQILKYAKVVTIRDEQKKVSKRLKNDIKKKDEKMDLIMELERLKGLKQEEEEKHKMKLKKLEEAKIIIEQMNIKKKQKEKEKEAIIKEGEELKKHIKELEEADKIIEQKKIIEKLNLAKEIVEKNKIAAQNRIKILQEEKENALKILKYNMERAKKEEEETRQKKLIQMQKEIETQKLREKQEKISDNQALLDELRAKRYVEENEKKEREKELNEVVKLIKKKKELIEGNEEQKIKKRNRLAEQALNEEKEYETMIKLQIKEKEEEKIFEQLRRKTFEENGRDVLRQIRERKEKKLFEKRYKLEEGRILNQNQEEYFKTLERIKLQKLKEMEKMGIDPKYRVELEKLKIV